VLQLVRPSRRHDPDQVQRVKSQPARLIPVRTPLGWILARTIWGRWLYAHAMRDVDMLLMQQVVCRIAILHVRQCETWGKVQIPGLEAMDIEHLPDLKLRGVTCYHHAMSTWERSSDLLWAYEICEPDFGENETPSDWASQFRFKVDLTEIPGCVSRFPEGRRSEYPLIKCLDQFLGMAADYGGALPSTHRPFLCPEIWMPDILLLKRAGFIFQVGDQFVWTSKIGPAMREQYLWTDSNECAAEARARAQEELAWKMWQSMPDNIADMIFRNPADKHRAAFVGMAFRFWDDRELCWGTKALDRGRISALVKIADLLEQAGVLGERGRVP